MRPILAMACAAVSLACASPAGAANVQTSTSGWLWGSPLPQGHGITALAFAGAQGYAVGNYGAVLGSADGGATWTGLHSGTFTDLTEVQAITPTAVFAGGGCAGRLSDDGGRTFRRVAFTPVEYDCRETLSAAWWVSPRTGYVALRDGTVLRTDDGGETFAQRNPVPGRLGVPDMVFLTDRVGVALAGQRIYRTTDGAVSWVEVSAGRTLRALRFVDAATGYAVGDESTVLKTTDAGATWTPVELGIPPRQLTSIACADAQRCVMTVDRGKEIVRATSLGAAPATLVSPAPSEVYGAAFAGAGRLVVAGYATAISDDGGATFSAIGGRPPKGYRRIRAGGQAGTAFAAGDEGALGKTLDGGATWTHTAVPTRRTLRDVSFPTAATGYALDRDGALFRTRDGGAGWRKLDTGTSAKPTAVLATSPSNVLLVGPTGVRRSSNGGRSFATVRDRDVGRRTEMIDRAGRALVVYDATGRTLVRSTNGGRGWTRMRAPGGRRAGIERVDFVSPSTGFLIGTDGRLWKTANGGGRWRELPAVYTPDSWAGDLAFESPRRGWVAIPMTEGEDSVAYLLRTTDGGRTFRPQQTGNPFLEAGAIAAAPGRGYLLDQPDGLLFARNGGDAGAPSALSLTTARRRLAGSRRITLRGRLSPASANELVTVTHRNWRPFAWDSRTVKTASNGAFTASFRVRRGTNVFVARWDGNPRNRGAGSEALTVRVGR